MGRRKILPLAGGLFGTELNTQDVGLGASGDDTDTIYLGDSTINGCWRLVVVDTNLSFQRLEGGIWVEKSAIVP